MTVDAVVNVFIKDIKGDSERIKGDAKASEGQRFRRDAIPTNVERKLETESVNPANTDPLDLKNDFQLNKAGVDTTEATVDAITDAALPPASSVPSWTSPDTTAPATMQQINSSYAPLCNECAFCGVIGTPRTCGILVPVKLGSIDTAVHHACALWAPQVYQPQGCDDYIHLELELQRSRNRICLICGCPGAAVTCMHASCRAAYHLPCAASSSEISMEKATFELLCPKHTLLKSYIPDYEEIGRGGPSRTRSNRRATSTIVSYRDFAGDGSGDEDFYPESSSGRPKRHAALTRKHRFQRIAGGGTPQKDRAAVIAATTAAALAVSDRTQRPRTDWQRQGDAWVKVVPPWWCENRTIHFANKVFRELFCGQTTALLVDTEGREWDCVVACETRNDMRLQYTLRGQFHDYWDSVGVTAGDVLTFEGNMPSPGKIRVSRFPQGRGLEECLMGKPDHENQEATAGITQVPAQSIASKDHNQSAPPVPAPRKNVSFSNQLHEVDADAQQSHPNRWTELPDGSAAKNVYKSTLAHQQCPIPGWLYNKLYGKMPGEVCTAAMRDPMLATDFTFEVEYVPAANVHYISGKAFVTWLKSAHIQNGDQIRIWKDKNGVKICRMAGTSASDRPTSPPSAGAIAPLHALAAAAGYADTHGTPAIDAVLSHAAELRNQGIMAVDGLLETRLAAAGFPVPPSPFRSTCVTKKRKIEDNEDKKKVSTAPIQILPTCSDATTTTTNTINPNNASIQHAIQQLLRHYHATKQLQNQTASLTSGAPLSKVTTNPLVTTTAATNDNNNHHDNNNKNITSATTTTSLIKSPPPSYDACDASPPSFACVTAAFNKHQWSPAETALLVRFRAKCAILDSTGRDVAFLNVIQLQNSKQSLLELIRGILSE